MSRWLPAVLVVAFLATTGGWTEAIADPLVACCESGCDDGCPDDAPTGCSSLCASCACTSVMVVAPRFVELAVPRAMTRIDIPNERTERSAPLLAGIFRPPRYA